MLTPFSHTEFTNRQKEVYTLYCSTAPKKRMAYTLS